MRHSALSRAGGFFALGAAAAAPSGCGSRPGGLEGEVGTYDPDGGGAFRDDGSSTGPGALDAHIEESGIAIQIVRLGCTAGCADVEVVATGGHPPYAYAWDDGATGRTRRICPASTRGYAVTVTDQGAAGELAQKPQSARTSVTAEVLACPGGGPSDAGGATACVSNPSFEGNAQPTYGTFSAAAWVQCETGALFATIWNQGEPFGIPPSDGATYLRLAGPVPTGGLDAGAFNYASASEPLCASLEAGTTYGLKVDVALELQDSQPGTVSLEVRGGASACSAGELLWTSPPLTSGSWQTYCATLRPTRDAPYLTLAMADPSTTGGAIYVDHLVPVEACP